MGAQSGDPLRQLLIELIRLGPVVTAGELAHRLHYNPKSIYRQLERLSFLLAQHDVEIEKQRFKGIELRGSEFALRRLLTQLVLQPGFPDSEDEWSVDVPKIQSIRTQLEDFDDEISIGKLEEIVSEYEQSCSMFLSDQAYFLLIISLTLKILRSREGNVIQDYEGISPVNSCYLNFAKSLLQRVDEEFGTSLANAEGELYELALCLGSSQVFEDKRLPDDLEIQESLNMARNMIDEMEKRLKLPLSEDSLLLHGIVFHLRSVLKRLPFHIQVPNPILPRLIDQYGPLYFTTREVVAKLEEESPRFRNLRMDRNEVGFLALHFGGAIKRIQPTIQILVLCNGERGEIQFIKSEMQKSVTNAEIHVIPSHLVSLYMRSPPDLLIHVRDSGEALPKTFQNVEKCIVGFPFASVDISAVQEAVTEARERKVRRELSGSTNGYGSNVFRLLTAIDSAPVIINDAEMNCTEDIIRTLAQKMCGGDCEKSIPLTERILSRESIGATAMSAGWAAPHISDFDGDRPQAGIALLKKGVPWAGARVWLVVMLVMSPRDEDLFKVLWERLNDKSWISLLRKAQSSEKVRSMMLDRIQSLQSE